jgi:hypothetical protein
MSSLCGSVAPDARLRSAASSFWDVFWAWLDHIAAVIAIVGLPYLVVSNRRRVPRFSFDFSAGGTQTFERDKFTYCRYMFSGFVTNKSLDGNSLQRTCLVVWKDKKRKEILTLRSGAIISENGEMITEPITFRPGESRSFDINFEIQLTGDPDVTVLTPTSKPVAVGGGYYRPGGLKYRYEVAFEDFTGSLYDQHGMLRNFEGIRLRMVKADQRPSGQNNLMPRARLLLLIALTDAVFFMRRNARRLGI